MELSGDSPVGEEKIEKKSGARADKKITSSLLTDERVKLPSFKESDLAFKHKSKKMENVKKKELKSTVFQMAGEAPLSMFPSRKFPMKPSQRDALAKTMSVEEVMQTTMYPEDDSTKGAKRWKEIRHLFLVTRKPEHKHGSIENALWYYGQHGVSCNHFVHAIMDEFKFHPKKDDMEAHLHWLYWSFPGGTADNADWRDILATLRIVIYFRMVSDRPHDLLLTIFDIYCVGGATGKSTEGHPNDVWYITEACDTLKKIFITCCETPYENDTMSELVDKAILAECGVSADGQDKSRPYALQEKLRAYNHSMKRRAFRQFIRVHADPLVKRFQEYCWKRLPVDLRLQSLDEQQVHALKESDRIMYRFKLQQALHIYKKNLLKAMWVDWVTAARRLSVVRRHNLRKYKYKKVVFFNFWRKLSSTERVKRNKRILADVMGNYSMKARYFARIKLAIYTEGYIIRTVGRFNKHAKTEKLAFSHMREFIRLRWQRHLYHRWWGYCVQEHNRELAEAHDWERLLIKPLQEWHKWAAWQAQEKRMEKLVIENKMKFDRQMKEAEVAYQELLKVEEAKRKKEEEERAAAAEIEKQERLAKARETARKEKLKERDILLGVQRDERRRRVRKDMQRTKKKFAEKWVLKKQEFIDKAKQRIANYVADTENERAIEMKFEKIKREFFMPPAKENMDRERILANPKNVVFLYLDAKVRKDNLKMEGVIYKFDEEKKGYLTYDEFKKLVKALGVKLNPSQMAQVIKSVDADGDGCLELDELLESMKDIERMGVVGSPWKMYIDGAQDVIVYHNFLTDEKVYEYQVTDEILKQVNLSNYFGEADEQARVDCEVAKKEDWELVVNTLMARRIQYMYRFWKSRKKRRAFAWKLKTRESNEKRQFAYLIAMWCAQHYHGYKSRIVFERELKLTYEKIYKADSGEIFWYNHLLGTSHWDRPHILWRYGDVPMPADWIPIDVPTVSDEELAADPSKEQMYALHYWHVKAQRDLPRKPDGLPPCCVCNRNLAKFSCQECHRANFCFKCYRDSHASPMHFAQKSFLTMEQRRNPKVLEQAKFSKTHNWEPVKYPYCQLCKTEKILAGMHCTQCNMDMCRRCSRRVHEKKGDHEVYAI